MAEGNENMTEELQQLFGAYLNEGETLGQFRDRLIADPDSFDFGSFSEDSTQNWKGFSRSSDMRGYPDNQADMYASSFFPDELANPDNPSVRMTEDDPQYLYSDPPGHFKKEALTEVYKILSQNMDGRSSYDITDVIKKVALARWETDFSRAHANFMTQRDQGNLLNLDPMEAAKKAFPYPIRQLEKGGDLVIDPESIYHPDHENYVGNISATPADAAGDPEYEKMIMDNMLEQDESLF
tara:strand:+ start:544 stop:1260 length:717 start_codon:yes stop_codon:yes gene_type:complete